MNSTPCATRLRTNWCVRAGQPYNRLDGGKILDNFWYLFVAYMVIWTAIFLYVLSLARKNRELRDELQVLRARVDQLRVERGTG